jgi:hypothetical protein
VDPYQNIKGIANPGFSSIVNLLALNATGIQRSISVKPKIVVVEEPPPGFLV